LAAVRLWVGVKCASRQIDKLGWTTRKEDLAARSECLDRIIVDKSAKPRTSHFVKGSFTADRALLRLSVFFFRSVNTVHSMFTLEAGIG
jgi:hypothetical protein